MRSTRAGSLWRVRAAAGVALTGSPAARWSATAALEAPPPIRVPVRCSGRPAAVTARTRRPTIWVCDGRTSLTQFSGDVSLS